MKESDSPASVCKAWWATCIAADTGAARQARALLRRAASVTDALTVSATHRTEPAACPGAGHDLRKRRDGARIAWP